MAVRRANVQPRLGTPQDCAKLVRFLCSEDGQWINGQLLYSTEAQVAAPARVGAPKIQPAGQGCGLDPVGDL